MTPDEQVIKARAAYGHAVKRYAVASVDLRAAGGELFVALRHRYAVRAAMVLGDTGDLLTPTEDVPIPCATCYREISPHGNEAHTIVLSPGELPYARCERPAVP